MRKSQVKPWLNEDGSFKIAFRSIYRRLLEKVIIHPLDDTRLQLEFIFNNVSTATNKVVDIFCAVVGLVGDTGARYIFSSPFCRRLGKKFVKYLNELPRHLGWQGSRKRKDGELNGTSKLVA